MKTQSLALTVLSCIAILVLVDTVLAIGPVFGPPRVTDVVCLYDTEGRVGWVDERIGSPGLQPNITADIGGDGQLFIDGDYENALVSFDGLSVSFETGTNGIPPYPGGTPYYVRRNHPELGCFSTFGYVGAQFNNNWPILMIPVAFSEYNIPNREVDIEAEEEGPEQAAIIIYDAMVADEPTTISLAARLSDLLAADLPPWELTKPHVMLEYLPGNTHTGTVHWTYDQFYWPQLHWGEPNSNDPSIMELGPTSPVGPVRVSLSYDGYTTDTITINMEKRKAYYWNPVIQATTGPTPTGYNPNAGILDQGVADALLGECNPSATLRSAWDPNGDGKTDAADFTTPDVE